MNVTAEPLGRFNAGSTDVRLIEPAMLIGMDALGLLDTLIIDYRRHELQIRMRQ